jgi:hypothetical protein
MVVRDASHGGHCDLGGGEMSDEKTPRGEMSEEDWIKAMHGYVRSMWAMALKRERAELPADGQAAETKRKELSADIKVLVGGGWDDAEKVIRGRMEALRNDKKGMQK